MYSKRNALIEVWKLFMPIIVMLSIIVPIIIMAPSWMLHTYGTVVLLSFLAVALYGITLYNISLLNSNIMEIILLFKNRIMRTESLKA